MTAGLKGGDRWAAGDGVPPERHRVAVILPVAIQVYIRWLWEAVNPENMVRLRKIIHVRMSPSSGISPVETGECDGYTGFRATAFEGDLALATAPKLIMTSGARRTILGFEQIF